ncbi:hypothetical protein [Litoreibacter janthinus]|uniref:Uncharacterized protein n=1 Tax=Litoreibacter janthinus TaxID=670154 RepID=A0A1I6GEP8_9RHOB|nr:hypothetical protein [Litoreibacter janthinus]SFR40656.1 hypothetical protein SAMN04488002_1353 [Litoreibacter janthinus]
MEFGAETAETDTPAARDRFTKSERIARWSLGLALTPIGFGGLILMHGINDHLLIGLAVTSAPVALILLGSKMLEKSDEVARTIIRYGSILALITQIALLLLGFVVLVTLPTSLIGLACCIGIFRELNSKARKARKAVHSSPKANGSPTTNP